MNVINAFLIAVSFLCCGPVYSINDLSYPVRYVDKGNGYFISVKDDKYRIGTAIDDIKNPFNDVPQVSGVVDHCSSKIFRCKSIGYLVFVIPKDGMHLALYRGGPEIVIRPLADGGWHGSAACSMLTKTGCASHVDVEKAVVTYQYRVDSNGVLKSISIQNWNSAGSLISTQNLVLVSGIGLRLKQ